MFDLPAKTANEEGHWVGISFLQSAEDGHHDRLSFCSSVGAVSAIGFAHLNRGADLPLAVVVVRVYSVEFEEGEELLAKFFKAPREAGGISVLVLLRIDREKTVMESLPTPVVNVVVILGPIPAEPERILMERNPSHPLGTEHGTDCGLWPLELSSA